MTRARIKQEVIRFSISAKVRDRYQIPASRESWAIGSCHTNVVVHVPDCGLVRARIVKDPVGLPVVVKVTGGHQFPATGKGWPGRFVNENVFVKIPDRRLSRAGIVSYLLVLKRGRHRKSRKN